MKNEKIRKKWELFSNDEKYKKYFISEDNWNYKLEQVKTFIDEHKERPTYSDKNEDNKKLGAWIRKQKQDYKKNQYIMKNEKIRNKWESFINDKKYRLYFKT